MTLLESVKKWLGVNIFLTPLKALQWSSNLAMEIEFELEIDKTIHIVLLDFVADCWQL